MRPPTVPAPEGFYGCSLCKQIKPLDEFPKQPRRPNGRGSHCKECRAEWMRGGKPRVLPARPFQSAYADEFQREPTDQERAFFEAKINKDGIGTGCWEWTASVRFEATKERGKRMYGAFWFDRKTRYAHRVSWHFNGGQQPTDLVIDHICMNGRCVNPDHLRVVTRQVNSMENCIERKRRKAA